MFSNNLTTTFSYLSLETRTYINRLATKLNGLKRNFGKLMIYLEPGDEWPNVIVAYPDPRNPCWYCEIFDSTDWSEEALNGTINLPIFINRLYKMRENVNYDSPLMQIVIYVRGKLVFDDPMFLFRRIPTVLYERGGYHLNNEGRNDTINQLLNMTEFDKKTFLDFLKRIRFYPIEYIRDFDRLDRYNAILTQAFNPGIATESFDAIFTKIDSCFENGSNKDCDFDVNLELFRGYQIHFAVHPELLVEFFKSTTKRILYIKTESSFLTILRIIDLLSKEEIFLPSRNKFNFTECLTYWLNSHHNIFIIEDTTSMETMLSELSLVLSRDSKFSNSNKKVILVNQSHQISNNALQTIDSFDDKGWFTDLSEDVQNYLVTREISFQGFYVKLEDVLDKNTLLKTLDAPTLERLIQGWKLTIDFTNKFTHMFPDTLKRTLRRQLVNRDVLNSDFLSNNLVLLSNITAEGLSKLKIEAVPYSECENHKSGLFIFNNSEENLNKFHKLCGDRTEKAIYWLEYKESKEREESLLFLKDFSGNTDSFLENLEDLPFSEEMEVHTYVPNNKVNIVTALPGMRKNEFVRGYLSGAFKLNNLTYWVFFDIFLENEGLDRLSKQFLNKFDYSRLIIFCNFENLVKLKTQDVVVKQIQYLASKKCTIWITCDLESRVKVQILLQTAAYRINPLKGPEKFYYFVKETCGHYYDVIPDWTKTRYYKLMNIIDICDRDRYSKIEFTAFPGHLYRLTRRRGGRNLLSILHSFIYYKLFYDGNEIYPIEDKENMLNLLKKIAANEYNLIEPKLSYGSVDERIFKLDLMFLEKEKLVFVHNMFKYYLLALYIVENSIDNTFMVKVLTEDEYSLIRKILNDMTVHPDDTCLKYNNIFKDKNSWLVIGKLTKEGNKNLAKFLTDDFFRLD